MVQHGGGDARQGHQLGGDGGWVGDPGTRGAAVRRDHRGGKHPVQVGEGRCAVLGQYGDTAWPAAVLAAEEGPRRYLQMKDRS